MKSRPLFTILLLLLLTPASLMAAETQGPWLEPSLMMVNSGMRQMNWGYDTSPFATGQQTADDGTGFFNSGVDGYDYPWFFETRMRPALTFHGNARLRGLLQMELNSVWGRESSVGNMDYGHGYLGKLRMRQYWMSADLQLTGDRLTTVQLGRQPFDTLHGIVVGLPMMEGIRLQGLIPKDWGNLRLSSAIVDTRGNLDVKNTWHYLRWDPKPIGRFQTSLYGCYLHLNDDANPDLNQYKDPLSYTKAPRLTNGSFIMGRDDLDNPTGGVADVFWLGAHTSGSHGPFFITGDAIVNFASFAQSDTSLAGFTSGTGFFLHGEVTYDTGVFGIGPSLVFASGSDGDRSADSYTGFLGMAPDYGYTRMFFDGAPIYNVFGHDDASVTGSGLAALKIASFYRLSAETRLNLQVAFLNAHKDRPQMPDPDRGLDYARQAEGAGTYYGTEMNLWVDWAPVEGVNFTAEVDLLVPGSYYKGNDVNGFGTDLDNAYRILLSSQVNF